MTKKNLKKIKYTYRGEIEREGFKNRKTEKKHPNCSQGLEGESKKKTLAHLRLSRLLWDG